MDLRIFTHTNGTVLQPNWATEKGVAPNLPDPQKFHGRWLPDTHQPPPLIDSFYKTLYSPFLWFGTTCIYLYTRISMNTYVYVYIYMHKVQ